MVGRGADEGKTERDVDAAVEVERLQGNERLVVIHAEGRVIAPPRRRVEQRVGRERPERVDALLAQQPDRRLDRLDLLAPHGSAFAGMRIEARDGNARLRNAEIAAKRRRRNAADGDDRARIERGERFLQCHVHRHRHDAQLGRHQHHHRPRPAGERAQILGVAWI